MKKYFLVTSTLLAAIALPAAASDFYVLADIGQSKVDIDSESESKTAFSIGGGFRLNETFAIEIVYRDLGEFKESYTESYDPDYYVTENFKVSFSALQASLVAAFPVSQSGSVYGRLGIADLEIEASSSYTEYFFGDTYSGSSSASESKNKAVFGIGYRHALNESWALRAEYNQYAKWDEIQISSLTAGLTYQF